MRWPCLSWRSSSALWPCFTGGVIKLAVPVTWSTSASRDRQPAVRCLAHWNQAAEPKASPDCSRRDRGRVDTRRRSCSRRRAAPVLGAGRPGTSRRRCSCSVEFVVIAGLCDSSWTPPALAAGGPGVFASVPAAAGTGRRTGGLVLIGIGSAWRSPGATTDTGGARNPAGLRAP